MERRLRINMLTDLVLFHCCCEKTTWSDLHLCCRWRSVQSRFIINGNLKPVWSHKAWAVSPRAPTGPVTVPRYSDRTLIVGALNGVNSPDVCLLCCINSAPVTCVENGVMKSRRRVESHVFCPAAVEGWPSTLDTRGCECDNSRMRQRSIFKLIAQVCL